MVINRTRKHQSEKEQRTNDENNDNSEIEFSKTVEERGFDDSSKY